MNESAGAHQLAGAKLGNHRLVQPLGVGRMGVVYLAQDEALLRPTAVKILSWSFDHNYGQDPVEWFLSEARTVARITHPGIVQIYHVGRHRDYYYIAMEYVDGPSLEVALARDGRFTPARATDVLLQAAEALHAAHTAGVVHRDIKPANLLITSDGVVKLSDFGMALNPTERIAQSGELRVGTPYYTPPELWRHQPASEASDLYSLGATYYHLLTGEPPYRGRDVDALQEMHLQAPVPDPRDRNPNIPAACAEIVRRCLAKSPHDRHRTARDLAWAARSLLREAEAPWSPDDWSGPELLPITAGDSGEEQSSFLRARGKAAEVLGFAWQPFGGIDARRPPYRGEPFETLGMKLTARTEHAGSLTMLTGPAGSGRTAVVRRVMLSLAKPKLVLHLDLTSYRGGRTLLERLRRAAGASGSAPQSQDREIDAILQRLDEVRRVHRRTSVIVLDGVTLTPEEAADVELLVAAASGTGSFSLVLIGQEDLPERVHRAGIPFHGLSEGHLIVPPLTLRETAGYLQSWIEATLSSEAGPVIISPDAALLVGWLTSGNLALINRLGSSMVQVAAASGRRVITSWDAWVCSEYLDETVSTSPAHDPRLQPAPAGWPTAEASVIIQTCREQAGMPPRVL